MKKFAKVMLIVAAVCAILGVGLCVAGKALGGSTTHHRVVHIGGNTVDMDNIIGFLSDDDDDWDDDDWDDNDWDDDDWDNDDWDVQIGDDSSDERNGNDPADGADSYKDIDDFEDLEQELDEAMPDADIEADNLQKSYTVSADDVSKLSALELQVDGGALLYKTGDYDEITVYVNEAYANLLSTSKNGGRLRLKIQKKTSWSEYPIIAVCVPEDKRFSDVDIELNAGKLNAQTICASSFDLESAASKAEMEAIDAQTADLQVDAGYLVVETLSAQEAEIECNASAVKIYGGVVKKGDFLCNAGAQSLCLSGDADDYAFDIEASLGSVRVNDDTFAGLSKEIRKSGGAGKFELECNAGSITLELLPQGNTF